MLVTQLCPTLCDPMDKPTRLISPWNSPGKNTGVSSHFLLQGIFPTQESNPGLLHCRWIKPPKNRRRKSWFPGEKWRGQWSPLSRCLSLFSGDIEEAVRVWNGERRDLERDVWSWSQGFGWSRAWGILHTHSLTFLCEGQKKGDCSVGEHRVSRTGAFERWVES